VYASIYKPPRDLDNPTAEDMYNTCVYITHVLTICTCALYSTLHRTLSLTRGRLEPDSLLPKISLRIASMYSVVASVRQSYVFIGCRVDTVSAVTAKRPRATPGGSTNPGTQNQLCIYIYDFQNLGPGSAGCSVGARLFGKGV
jgi:hypothetical protein